MKLAKRITGIVTAAITAISVYGGHMFSEVQPLKVEAESYYDYLIIQIVDEDEDGTDDYIEIIDCDESVTEVEIPSEIMGYPVKSIGDWAFSSCRSLTSVIIGNSVKSIGDGAFNSCFGLTSITMGNGITSIGDYAFELCGMKAITIPKSVVSIGKRAFADCFNLEDIIIMNSKCKIPDYIATISSNHYATDNGARYCFDGTIHGYDNSTAQTYAENYEYKFKSMGQDPDTIPLTAVPNTGVRGDANGDSTLNIRDAANIAKYLSRGKVSLLPANVDFDGDGNINVRDAAALASYLSKKQ